MREYFNNLYNLDLLYPLQFVNQFDIIPSSNDVVKVYICFWQKSETLYSSYGIRSSKRNILLSPYQKHTQLEDKLSMP
jgi:hypothetical protein